MRMTYRTLDDVLDAPWATWQPGPKSTTDRVLRSTRLEDAIYDELFKDDAALDQIVENAEKDLPSFSSLSRDIFQAFYSLSPSWNQEDMLSIAAQKFNTRLLSHVMQQDDYPTLKNICEGRELPAYEAAAEFIRRTAGELKSLLSDLGGEKGALHTLEKLISSRDKAAKDFAALLEQYRRSQNTNPTLEQALITAANLADSKQMQVEAVSKMADASLLRRTDQIEALTAAAICSAREQAEETRAIIGAWSDSPGDLKRSPTNLELLSQVRKSQKLRDISRYLGRFREIIAQGRRNGYNYGRGETYSLELGNNLSRVITSELAMLADPATIPLFLRKYYGRRLKQYLRREPAHKGRGDMICCLDESGSTQGENEAWGKAVALALLELAASRGRKFALIHFSGPNSFSTDLFLPGRYTAENKLRAAETFLGGGTDFETPLKEALRLMEQHEFAEADIVFLTDGECSLPELFRDQLTEAQRQRRFSIIGILLDAGGRALDFSLQGFCQKIYRTSELTGEEILTAMICDRG